MKKHAKIVFKEFGSSFGRFIAITGIIALGVALLMGLSFVTPDMKNSYNEFFDKGAYFDFTVYPGITEMPDTSVSIGDIMGMTQEERQEFINEMNDLKKALPDDEAIAAIRSGLTERGINGVTVEGVVSADVYYSVPEENAEKAVRVVSAGTNGKEGLTSVNSLTLVSGEWPKEQGEVIAIRPFGDMYDIASATF